MAKSSSAMGHFWLSKFHSTSVISINFFSNVIFSFWWERNLSIFMKGSATGLLENLWEEIFPKHEAASPASASTSGWVMRTGCRKGNAIIAISSFVLLHPVASCRHGWSRQLPGCSSIMRVSKGEKLCTPQQPLDIYLLLQQQSQQSLLACLPAGSWWSPTTPLGNMDGTDQDHPHPLRRGWANWAWGKF